MFVRLAERQVGSLIERQANPGAVQDGHRRYSVRALSCIGHQREYLLARA